MTTPEQLRQEFEAELAAYAKKVLGTLPPLTPEQRDRITALLAPVVPPRRSQP